MLVKSLIATNVNVNKNKNKKSKPKKKKAANLFDDDTTGKIIQFDFPGRFAY